MTGSTALKAQRDLIHIIKETNTSHHIYHIHHSDGDAVIMSED